MTELKAFAENGLGTSMQVAKRSPGAALILPSVVHWNLGHYGALIRGQDGTVLLKTPPSATTHGWTVAASMPKEAAIPRAGRSLAEGWTAVGDEEASTIFGKGHSGNSDNDDTSECSRMSGGGCSSGRRMADYAFHTMLASLHILTFPSVTPRARSGRRVQGCLQHARERAAGTMLFTNFSPLWVSRWVSYLEDNPAQPAATSKSICAAEVSKPMRGLIPRAGLSRKTPMDTVLHRIDTDTYERRHPDGSKEVYSQAIGTTGPARQVFLKQIVDPQGNAVTLNYDTTPGFETRITSITDATGFTSSFSYNQSGAPYLVTAITDPFGRFATSPMKAWPDR
jgi:YD repeat-containing protein